MGWMCIGGNQLSDRPMKLSRPLILSLLLIGTTAATGGLWWLERQHPQQVEPWTEYSLIEKGLYMGGAAEKPPPGTRAVLNLCQHKESYQCEVHVWEPTPDRPPAPSLDWLRKQVAFVTDQHKAGRTVFVHCHAGISRSGMVVTAYLMRKHKWSRDEALKFVRTKRSIADPNPAFMELLLDWERALKEKKP